MVAKATKFAGKLRLRRGLAVEASNLLLAQLHVERVEVLIELIEAARADDGRRDARPRLHPGDSATAAGLVPQLAAIAISSSMRRSCVSVR